MCNEYGILKSEKWFKLQPESIREAKETTILWNIAIQTNRKIKINKPDFVVEDYKRELCLLIDI